MKKHNQLINTHLWRTSVIPLYGYYIKNTSHKVYRKLIALGYKPCGGNLAYNLEAKLYYINVIGEILYDAVSKNMIEVRLNKKNNLKVILD